jgi:hypothetical protein
LNPGSVAREYQYRKSNWTPSIVPDGDDQNVYLVADDLGVMGGGSGGKPILSASI